MSQVTIFFGYRLSVLLPFSGDNTSYQCFPPVLGIKPRARQVLYHRAISPGLLSFVVSWDLSAKAGLKLASLLPVSQVARITDLSYHSQFSNPIFLFEHIFCIKSVFLWSNFLLNSHEVEKYWLETLKLKMYWTPQIQWNSLKMFPVEQMDWACGPEAAKKGLEGDLMEPTFLSSRPPDPFCDSGDWLGPMRTLYLHSLFHPKCRS